MFKPATRKASRLRLALVGPSGAGKSYTALSVATGLGGKIAVVDTERGSASKYAGAFRFDTDELESFHPQRYIDAIADAEKAGYDVLILDSLSHAWTGRDGALELVDQAARRSKSGSSFNAWRDVTPLHNALLDAILRCRCHVIATMRTKTEYVLERDEKSGKTVPRKVGLAPVQRDGVEYEFDVVGDLDIDHHLVVTKSRCPMLAGKVLREPGAELGKTLLGWLGDGEGIVAPAEAVAPALPEEVFDPIEEVMDLIEKAQNNHALGAAYRRIEQLSPAQKKAVREAYLAKRRALNPEVPHAA